MLKLLSYTTSQATCESLPWRSWVVDFISASRRARLIDSNGTGSAVRERVAPRFHGMQLGLKTLRFHRVNWLALHDDASLRRGGSCGTRCARATISSTVSHSTNEFSLDKAARDSFLDRWAAIRRFFRVSRDRGGPNGGARAGSRPSQQKRASGTYLVRSRAQDLAEITIDSRFRFTRRRRSVTPSRGDVALGCNRDGPPL